MTTVSVAGPLALPKAPYGSFAGKPPSSGRVFTQVFSVAGPLALPRPPYASFAGKPSSQGGKVVEWIIRARRRGRR